MYKDIIFELYNLICDANKQNYKKKYKKKTKKNLKN